MKRKRTPKIKRKIKKRKQKLSLSSKLPGPGIHVEEKQPENPHIVLHDAHLQYTKVTTKLLTRLADDVSTLEDRITLLERSQSKRK